MDGQAEHHDPRRSADIHMSLNLSAVGWRAWYTRGRVFDAHDMEWRALPADGVIVIVVYHDDWAANGVRYRTLHDGYDYYWRDPGTEAFRSGDIRPDFPADLIKEGTEIPDDEFDAVKQRAALSTWP